MMKTLVRRYAAIATALALAASSAVAQPDGELPVVVVIATSGDIMALAQLFIAVPEATRLATLRGEQVTLDPSSAADAKLKLVRRIEAATSLPEVAGVVITHDAATIDDTAAYLRGAIKSAKPVVLTVAAAGEDRQNFHDAVAAALHKTATGTGVRVVLTRRH